MITIERSVWVDKPLDKVAAYMQDFCTTNEWDPGTVTTELLSGDGGLGSTFRNVSKFAGKKTELIYKVDEFEQGRVIGLVGDNKSVRAHDRITFTEHSDGTAVQYTAEFDFKGFRRFFEPLFRPALNKLGDDGQRGMEQRLAEL